MPTEIAGSVITRIITFLLPAYLIVSAIWKTLVTATEYPMRTEQVLTIGLNILAIVGLVGLRKNIPKSLFALALIAGIWLLVIRLTSDHAWWTGHFIYVL